MMTKPEADRRKIEYTSNIAPPPPPHRPGVAFTLLGILVVFAHAAALAATLVVLFGAPASVLLLAVPAYVIKIVEYRVGKRTGAAAAPVLPALPPSAFTGGEFGYEAHLASLDRSGSVRIDGTLIDDPLDAFEAQTDFMLGAGAIHPPPRGALGGRLEEQTVREILRRWRFENEAAVRREACPKCMMVHDLPPPPPEGRSRADGAYFRLARSRRAPADQDTYVYVPPRSSSWRAHEYEAARADRYWDSDPKH